MQEVYRFKYERMAIQAPRSGIVVFTLRRAEGPFDVGLSVEDAQRLYNDLPSQIRTSKGAEK